MNLIVVLVTSVLVDHLKSFNLDAKVSDSAMLWRRTLSANATHIHSRDQKQNLRGQQSDSLSLSSEFSLRKAVTGPGCKCLPRSAAWVPSNRTVPKCIFIDLGAANGNTFQTFLANGFGNAPDTASECGKLGDYQAFLVEANPRFDSPLHELTVAYPDKVHVAPSTAAYMCEGETTFYLDVTNHEVNYWGSSMSPNHPDAVKSGHTKVTVPTINLMKYLTENTIQGDFVLLKMDIEGAEWDILPCLANSDIAPRIKFLFVEKHPASWSVSNPPESEAESFWSQAVTALQHHGVKIPDYNSNTL